MSALTIEQQIVVVDRVIDSLRIQSFAAQDSPKYGLCFILTVSCGGRIT